MSSHESSLRERLIRTFRERHGREPTVLATAPGRVNVIGEHTDYNDGLVLPMGIERATGVAAAPRESPEGKTPGARIARIHSEAIGAEASFELPDEPGARAPFDRSLAAGDWTDYVRGVLVTAARRGLVPPGFDAVIVSDVPLGGGLSSSASLEIAVATALEGLCGVTLDPLEKALLAQEAEHEFAGVPCGLMDQYASTFARLDRLLLLDCRTQRAEAIPFDDPAVAVLVTSTNVHHALADGEYAKRRRECESAARKLGLPSLREASLETLDACASLSPLERRRARHVVTENERVRLTARHIARREWDAVESLLRASHDSLRDDYEVSCPELDLLVDIARDIGRGGGVLGARMTGGGFGGSTVSLVESERCEDLRTTILRRYREGSGRDGSAFVTRPAAGARCTVSN